MVNKAITGLIELGLSEKEAQLYQSSLKIGPATAQLLALESGLKRATVYGCIASLVEKGLFHVEIKGVKKLFIVEPPEKLALLLDRKKQVLSSILPQLTQDYLHSSPPINAIKIYHGLSGIKLLYDNILEKLKPGDEYLVISDQKKWHALDPDYFEAFIKKRAALDLKTKLILQNNEHARSYQNTAAVYNAKIKLLPEKMNLNTNMVIFSYHVLIVQTVEPFLAILIENQNVSEMNKVLFNTIWELLT